MDAKSNRKKGILGGFRTARLWARKAVMREEAIERWDLVRRAVPTVVAEGAAWWDRDPPTPKRGRFQIDSAKAMQDVERGFGRVVADARAVAKAAAEATAERPARAAAGGAVALFAALVGARTKRRRGRLTLGDDRARRWPPRDADDQDGRGGARGTDARHRRRGARGGSSRASSPSAAPAAQANSYARARRRRPHGVQVRPRRARGADHAAAETAPDRSRRTRGKRRTRDDEPRERGRGDARIHPPPRRTRRRGRRRRVPRRRRRRRRRLPSSSSKTPSATTTTSDSSSSKTPSATTTTSDSSSSKTLATPATSVLLRRRHRRRRRTGSPILLRRRRTPRDEREREDVSSANAMAKTRADFATVSSRDTFERIMVQCFRTRSRFGVVIAPGIFSRRGGAEDFFPLRPFSPRGSFGVHLLEDHLEFLRGEVIFRPLDHPVSVAVRCRRHDLHRRCRHRALPVRMLSTRSVSAASASGVRYGNRETSSSPGCDG